MGVFVGTTVFVGTFVWVGTAVFVAAGAAVLVGAGVLVETVVGLAVGVIPAGESGVTSLITIIRVADAGTLVAVGLLVDPVPPLPPLAV